MIALAGSSIRVAALSAVLLSLLLLASCSKPATPVIEQIGPVTTADTTFGASPNPIVVTDGSGLGLTTLTWSTTKSKLLEIRVNSPSGALLGSVSASGSTDTGKWVTNGMKFYLQDATSDKKTDPSATLAVITVKVIKQ